MEKTCWIIWSSFQTIQLLVLITSLWNFVLQLFVFFQTILIRWSDAISIFTFFHFPLIGIPNFFLKWKKIFLLYHFWWRCLPTPGFSSKCSFVHSSMVPPLSILNKYKGNQHLINKSLVKYAKPSTKTTIFLQIPWKRVL